MALQHLIPKKKRFEFKKASSLKLIDPDIDPTLSFKASPLRRSITKNTFDSSDDSIADHSESSSSK